MTDEHRAAEAPLKAGIRAGELVTSYRDFALTFQQTVIRNGVPRPVCVCAAMPSLVLQWKGSRYPTLLQSLS
jgi:hypothetical protein